MTILSADQIHELQENISKWLTQLSGMHVHSDKTELKLHLSQLGHFEFLQLFSKKYREQPDQHKRDLIDQLGLLNVELADMHRRFLMLLGGVPNNNTQLEYARKAKAAVDRFFGRMTKLEQRITPWSANDLPYQVKEHYDAIDNALNHWG